MGIATATSHHTLQLPHHISTAHRHHNPAASGTTTTMSHHGFHHGILGFPQDGNGDDDGDDLPGRGRPHPTMDHPPATDATPAAQVYDPNAASSILSEMLGFAGGAGPSATELLASQISAGWYGPSIPPPPAAAAADSAAAMQLFLMNPQVPQQQPQRGFSGAGQGLSLSLSSSLQQLEAVAGAKPEELFYAQQQPPPSAAAFAAEGGGGHQFGQPQTPPMHVAAAALRQSKYARAAQELLEEFCSVGRGQVKRPRGQNPNPNGSSSSHAAAGGGAGGGGGASSSSSKEPVAPPLSAADRFEHQRKKSKLSSMLDEVDRRYNHYCDQMQMVVTSFDSVMGYGAAAPYTGLARKAMSRHFRCLKDAIVSQLRKTCEALGEKEGAAVTGISKGETPRLRLLDQSLRQQRTFNQMGMMDQEAWRPQRGLPERSVNILRSWLFEHFLHPYPNDADKHMLARQTGLSRNQVTNWFINARVRLWKPMVEEMYKQEFKEEEERERGEASNQGGAVQSPRRDPYNQPQRLEINVSENEPSSSLGRLHEQHHLSQHQQEQNYRFAPSTSTNHLQASLGGACDFITPVAGSELSTEFFGMDSDVLANYGPRMVGPGTQVQYRASGDVSLTLGLQHTGNIPESNRFSLRDFGGGGGGGGGGTEDGEGGGL